MLQMARWRRDGAGVASAVAAAILCAAGLAAAGRQAPPAQNPQPATQPQRPVFRGGTDVVRVDVYPRNRGRIVPDLSRDDFQVFEDGAPQVIETFEFIGLDGTGEDSGELDPRDAREAMRMAADPRNRVFVLFLDTYHVTWEGALRARDPILAFLREGLGPRDLFGVLTPQQAPELLAFGRTTSDAAMAMSLGRSWGLLDTPVVDAVEMQVQSCAMPPPGNRGPGSLLALWRLDRTLSRLEELVVRLSALRQERKNIVLVSDRWPNMTGMRRLPAPEAAAGDLARSGVALSVGAAARGQSGRGSFQAPTSLLPGANVCAAESSRLRGIDFRRRMLDLPELARAANVAFYVVVPGAQALFNDPSGQFRGLATDTDGLSLTTNDIGSSLARVTEHQAGYYMLGYRPAGPTDRRTRKVEVKTTRRGVDLELRREIYVPTTEDLANRDVAVREPTDVERAIESLGRIRDTTSLFVHVAPRADRLDVTAEVAARALAGARTRHGASIEVIARDAAGTEISRAVGQLSAGGRSARVFMPVLAGASPSRLNVRVTTPRGDLSEFVDVPARAEGLLAAAVVSRAGALPSMPFEPAADMQFQRTDRVRVEWPVSGPLEERTVRVVNAAGEERAVDLMVVDVDGERPVLRADLRLLSLAPADYVIAASARAGETAARQLLAFRVLR